MTLTPERLTELRQVCEHHLTISPKDPLTLDVLTLLGMLAEMEAAFSAEFSRGMDVDTDLVNALVQRDAAVADLNQVREANLVYRNQISSLNELTAILTTERDAALARLAKVEALVESAEPIYRDGCTLWVSERRLRAALAEGGAELAVGGEVPTKPPVELGAPSADVACTESTPCFDAAHYPSELCSVHRAEFFKWRAARAEGGGIDESN